MKLYFITDCDPNLGTGGAIIRKGQITYFKKNGFDVVVVKPGKNNYYDTENSIITIKGLIENNKLIYGLEATGLISDKNIVWANNVSSFLEKYVNESDIIFTTSGGTLAPIIAGAKIKQKTNAKLIINYHDPTDFTSLYGLYSRKSKFPHINRDKFEKKFIDLADYVITSSESYREVLLEKYPYIVEKSCCVYFGYIEPFPLTSDTDIIKNEKLINIVYGGNFGPTQSPEIIGFAAKGMPDIKVTYVGNYQSNNAILELGNEPNIELIPSIPLPEYLSYLNKNADIGFFSLRSNLTNYCVPSKVFDYINMGLPMIGLVKGDARSIIEDNVYGCISEDNIEDLRNQILKISDINFLKECKENILKDRTTWSMEFRIKKVLDIIRCLI